MDVQAEFSRAVEAHERGRPEVAVGVLDAIEQHVGKHPEISHLRGVCRLAMQDHAEAAVDLSFALESKSEDPMLLAALATARKSLGEFAPAEAALQRALSIAPNSADLQVNLGNLLRLMGRADEALEAYRLATTLAPANPDAWFNQGSLQLRLAYYDEAQKSFETVCHLTPNASDVWQALGDLCFVQGQLPAAIERWSKAAAFAPDAVNPAISLAMAQLYLGKAEAAIERMEALHEGRRTTSWSQSIYVYALNYGEETPPEKILAAAQQWDRVHGSQVCSPLVSEPPVRNDRSLRVGILSGDLTRHPIGMFVASFAPHLPDLGVDLRVYATNRSSDHVTEHVKRAASEWVDVGGMSDLDAAKRIARDDLDMLILTSAHADRSRLGIVAHRPAYLQIMGFGVFCTTGVQAVDYLLADSVHVPPEFEAHYSEKVLRLEHGAVCFDPITELPNVSPAPCLQSGNITFGSFNTIAKIGPKSVALWSRVLDAVPGSRLLLKARRLDIEEAAKPLIEAFAQRGVSADRLTLEGGAAPDAFIENYSRVDIALDPLGYSGGLTTLEALWMGVPTITLPGRKFCNRHSASHLTHCGLDSLIADDEDNYVSIAIRLAGDYHDLSNQRGAIRDSIASAPIGNGRLYAKGLVSALRALPR